MYILHRRCYKALRQSMLAQVTRTQREQMASYQRKAAGWFTVAVGATLLAAGQTWQIVRHYGWPAWLFWLLVLVMLTAAVLNTAAQMISDAHTRHAGTTEPVPAVEQHSGIPARKAARRLSKTPAAKEAATWKRF